MHLGTNWRLAVVILLILLCSWWSLPISLFNHLKWEVILIIDAHFRLQDHYFSWEYKTLAFLFSVARQSKFFRGNLIQYPRRTAHKWSMQIYAVPISTSLTFSKLGKHWAASGMFKPTSTPKEIGLSRFNQSKKAGDILSCPHRIGSYHLVSRPSNENE